MTSKPWETALLPLPNYGCAVLRCQEEVTYDADMLSWWQGGPSYPAGWYCDGCWDEAATNWVSQYEDNRDPSTPEAPSLAEEIARRDAAPDMEAALVGMLRSFERSDTGMYPDERMACNDARAAIAKAKGETP